MKTLKHTKGNWSLNYPNVSEENAPFIIGNELFEGFILNPICELKQTTETNTFELDEWEANAKLIATAPELLENLIRCVDRLEENGMGDMSAVRSAKEAIKKATE